MAKPTSRIELAEYCLRQLGAPVIEINIDDDQVEDRIDEALQFWHEYHSDAMVRTFVKYQVTEEDIVDKTIELPDAVLSVVRVLNMSTVDGNDMFSVKYQLFLNDLYGIRDGGIYPGGGLLHYTMNQDYLGLMEHVLNGNIQQISYTRHANTLNILTDWEMRVSPGDYIVVECYTSINPESYPEVYNDMALKRYLTALLKKQWGNNLKKFEGMQLPGGVTINGAQIYQEAVEELNQMEETWESKYSYPPDFVIG